MTKFYISAFAQVIFACVSSAEILNANAGDQTAIADLNSTPFAFATGLFCALAIVTLGGLFARAFRGK